MAQWPLGMNLIAVSAADFFAVKVTGLHEVGHHPMCSSRFEPDRRGDFLDPYTRIPGNREEYVSVVR